MDFFKEIEGKKIHDTIINNNNQMNSKNNIINPPRCVWIPGAIIIGAGPSGLATSACLKLRGDVPSIILERSNCIASLWKYKTYDRLRLHLPKQFCELPFMPFPQNFPTYPSKQQFIKYLEDYTEKFDIKPVFNQGVVSAEFDKNLGLWRVVAEGGETRTRTEYVSRWVVVATGENAEAVVPEIEGEEEYEGRVMHTSLYKSGEFFKGKRVLVVGCGNSGMEVCLDLCNHHAKPSLVVRDTVHVLPRVMLGKSTFGLSMWLLKWFPTRIVDRFLLLVSWLMLGDTAELGLHRPKVGPLELKSLSGKTPVLDVGTLDKIRHGQIKVCPGVRRLTKKSVEFTNGRKENFDAIILATGYKSNVPSWLKESEMFSEKDGLPKRPFPNGWKGECGLYAVGFTKRGLLGASMDAQKIAQDIQRCWTHQNKHLIARLPSYQ